LIFFSLTPILSLPDFNNESSVRKRVDRRQPERERENTHIHDVYILAAAYYHECEERDTRSTARPRSSDYRLIPSSSLLLLKKRK